MIETSHSKFIRPDNGGMHFISVLVTGEDKSDGVEILKQLYARMLWPEGVL